MVKVKSPLRNHQNRVFNQKITFRNFNFTTNEGDILLIGNDSKLQNCNFINNSTSYSGAVAWSGSYGTLTGCTFINNIATNNGGAIYWINDYEYVVNYSFINSKS